MTTTAKSGKIMSETAWARTVAARLELTDEAGIARVTEVLKDARIRTGRTRGRHRLKVCSVYFTGIKHLKPSDDKVDLGGDRHSVNRVEGVETDADRGGGSNIDAESATDGEPEPVATTAAVSPFGFCHEFRSPFTAFATDHVNDAGKSTILGVILWALRGDPPSPTLQSDIRNRWLREVAVVLDIDGARFVIAWMVRNGRPEGGIYAVQPGRSVGVAQWREQALAVARDELDNDGPTDRPWPATHELAMMVDAGTARLVTPFLDDDQFSDAAGDFMLSRLELDPVRTWAKRPQAADAHDGSVIEHGWPSLSAALAIIDPTVGTVMGEHVMLTQHLLGVYLGAKWSHTVYAARRNLVRTQAEVASLRRRAKADQDASVEDLTRLQLELAGKKTELDALGDVPDYDAVLEATRHANRDALLLQQTKTAEYDAASAYGIAERELSGARRELYVQAEAQVTKRFFHSLRPSCCPRCDAELGADQLERERDGHCSLCDGEFVDQPGVTAGLAVDAGGSTGDPEDDSLAAIRDHLEDLNTLVSQLSERHDAAREASANAETAAATSADALLLLDRAASTERRHLENQIARLEGRIAEREGLNNGRIDAQIEPIEFRERVYDAALRLATVERDLDQRQMVSDVSDTMTALGVEFGIRNLERAELRANGSVQVTKGGGDVSKYSDINAGERLRLKVALIIGLLRAGDANGNGRHPGLLIVDDLTTHEVSPENAAAMARALADAVGLQLITASTLGPTLQEAAGKDAVVMADETGLMF